MFHQFKKNTDKFVPLVFRPLFAICRALFVLRQNFLARLGEIVGVRDAHALFNRQLIDRICKLFPIL